MRQRRTHRCDPRPQPPQYLEPAASWICDRCGRAWRSVQVRPALIVDAILGRVGGVGWTWRWIPDSAGGDADPMLTDLGPFHARTRSAAEARGP